MGTADLGTPFLHYCPAKLSSEVNDISDALKKLSEQDLMPLFICTSSMAARTPLYESNSNPEMKYSTEKLSDIETTLKSIVNMIKPNDMPRHTDQSENTGSQKLDNIEESLKGIMNAISSGTTTQNTRQVGTSIGDTITVGDIETSTGGHSGKTWTDVVRKGRRKEGKPLPLDQTNLVVSGVKLGTLGLQLAKLLANNDIDLKDWDLLTTRSDATFLTFKIKMSAVDEEKGCRKSDIC